MKGAKSSRRAPARGRVALQSRIAIPASRGTRQRRPALWKCPRCRRLFANRNQTHACGRHPLTAHFAGRDPIIRRIYERFASAVRAIGPVRILPQKTRIAFQVRMSFAQVTPRRRWVDGHVVLARRADDPVFRSVQTFSPRNHVHTFRLQAPDDVTRELRRFIAEAYAVGRQEHLAGG
jgi:hypothetical protein